MSKKRDVIKADAFKYDNFLLRNPSIFNTQRRELKAGQQPLPGFGPLTTFDQWVTWALYARLDQDNPTAPKVVRIGGLADDLDFARRFNSTLAGEYHTSDTTEEIEKSLHRLRSHTIRLERRYERRTGKKREGFRMESNDPIVTSLAYIYSEGVTSADRERDRSKITDANTVKFTYTGDTPPRIPKRVDQKPVGIMFTINPQMLLGITARDRDNIGATSIPLAIFKLRRAFQPKPIANKLLGWAIGQTARTMKRYFLPSETANREGLLGELGLNPNQRARNIEAVSDGFNMLKQHGVIEDFVISEDEGGPFVTFTKAEIWHLERKKTPRIGKTTGEK